MNPLPNLASSWNIAPSRRALVVRREPHTGARHLYPLKWGLPPYWTKEPAKAKRPIHARAESVATSGMFRDAFAHPMRAFAERPPSTVVNVRTKRARGSSRWTKPLLRPAC